MAAEQRALQHLLRHRLRLVERNYRCTRGEIDLIMAEGDTTLFVEVRYRATDRFGDGAESVDRRKRQRLLAAAQHYLQCHPERAQRPCRFDVVALAPNREPHWIRDAFQE